MSRTWLGCSTGRAAGNGVMDGPPIRTSSRLRDRAVVRFISAGSVCACVSSSIDWSKSTVDVTPASSRFRSHLVMHEVQTPALVGQRQHGGRCPRADGALASLPATYRQTLFAVKPLGLLAVDRDAVPAQQDVKPPIAEPPALLRRLAQSRPQVAIISPARAVPHALANRSDDSTRPPLAHPQRRLEVRDRFPLRGGRHHFFESRSFRPALSSIVSASNRLSRPFSSSSARSRFASDISRPPNLAFHA